MGESIYLEGLDARATENPVQSVKTEFNNMGCLYLPVDDRDKIFAWYEKYFNSAGTRNVLLSAGRPFS